MAKYVPALGALVIGVVVLISYHPALPIGFWYDDYNILKIVGHSPNWQEFLAQTFDPRTPRLEYRPVREILWRIGYMLWGSDALPYHAVQNTIHLLNCLLVYALVARLSRNWRAGFIGALIFGVLPTYTLSVFWLASADPLVTLFYLLTIWVWIDYLETGGWQKFALTYSTFVVAFLCKELAVFLPIILLLVDRWLIAKPARWREWIPRNALFFLFLPIAVVLAWSGFAPRLTGATSVRTNWLQFFSGLTYYLGGLAFPWFDDSPVKYFFLVALAVVFVYAVLTRRFPVLFLGIFGFLTTIPNVNFVGVSSRHMYLALMSSAAGIGLLIDAAWNWCSARVRAPRGKYLLRASFVLGLGALTLWQSWTTAESATNFSSLARQARLQFRPIYQQHSAFEPDTLLYFIEPPMTSYNIDGLMFLRYGTNVSVKANDAAEYANLRASAQTYVIYPDEQNALQELPVARTATARAHPQPPIQFESGISLEGFEVVNTQAHANEAIILLLYWRATGKIDKDYTVFAHLLDAEGNILASHDSQPRRGATPTSSWPLNALNVDAIILPITPNTPPGENYRIEVGLYDLPTLERSRIVQSGNPTDQDTLIFSSFAVTR